MLFSFKLMSFDSIFPLSFSSRTFFPVLHRNWEWLLHLRHCLPRVSCWTSKEQKNTDLISSEETVTVTTTASAGATSSAGTQTATKNTCTRIQRVKVLYSVSFFKMQVVFSPSVKARFDQTDDCCYDATKRSKSDVSPVAPWFLDEVSIWFHNNSNKARLG